MEIVRSVYLIDWNELTEMEMEMEMEIGIMSPNQSVNAQ